MIQTVYDPRERDWYKQAIENKGETIISEPYADAGNNEMVITISKATDDGKGVMAVDILLTHLQKITNQVKIGDKGYALLLDENKKFIAHPIDDARHCGIQKNFIMKYTKRNKERLPIQWIMKIKS